jgi:hypothetical protein
VKTITHLSPALVRATILAGVGVTLLLESGCDVLEDKCKSEDFTSLANERRALKEKIAQYQKFKPPGAHLVADAAATATPSDKRLALTAGPISPYPLFRNIPNQSVGKFTTQVTVAFNDTTGFTSGQSAGGLKFTQSEYPPGGRGRFVGARYNDTINGLTAFVGDIFNGGSRGVPVNFPDASEVDVRIQQTDTQLIFSAGATPADQSAGGWTTVFAENTPVTAAPYQLGVGLRDVDENATFFFNHFVFDAEYPGGVGEAPSIIDLRSSINSVHAAQAKISAVSPDLNGATADLTAALAAHDQAIKDIRTAMIDYSLQRSSAAVVALKSLRTLRKDLAAAQTAVGTLDPAKAKAQLTKLDKVAGGQMAGIGNMLGWKVPNLKSLPPNILSLSLP